MAHRNDEKARALDAQSGHINDRNLAALGGTNINDARKAGYAGDLHINDEALAFFTGATRPDAEADYWASQP